MNELGDRLNKLAGRATAGVSLNDPSLAAAHAAGHEPKRRGLALGLVAACVVAAMLFYWPAGNSSTSVAAGEGADALAAAAASSQCATEPLLEVLRSGLPTFDYDPVGSFAALAEESFIAVSGSIVSVERVDMNGMSSIELGLDDVVELNTGVAQPDVDLVAYQAAWNDGSVPDPLLDFVPHDDVRFVGFLAPWSGIRGGWNPGIEGLYVSCGDAGPLQAVIINASGGLDPIQPTRSELKALLADDEPVVPDNAAQATVVPRQAEPATPSEAEELQRASIANAQRQWQSSGINDYRLRYAEFRSEGRSIFMTLRIEAGQLIEAEFAEGVGESERTWTVDEMFAAAAAADTVREFEFDPLTGAPRELSLDPDRTVSGDEFAFRLIELVQQSDLDAVDEMLNEWLPAPSAVPEALKSILEEHSSVQADPVDEVYVLHEVPGVDVFLYVYDAQVCVVGAQTDQQDPLSYKVTISTCRLKTDFVGGAINMSHIGRDGDVFTILLVVPPLILADEDWSFEGVGGELDATERSALLVVDGPGEVGQQRLLFQCDCGDQVFNLSN